MQRTKIMMCFALMLAVALCLGACSRDLYGSSPGGAEPSPSGEASVEAVVEPSSAEERILSEQTAKLLRSGVYYLDGVSIIEVEGMRLENAVTVAASNGNSSVKTTSEMSGALTTMRLITLEGKIWLVNDTTKTCIGVDPAEMSGSFDTDFSLLVFEERGEGLFDGETMRYEQYSQQEDAVRFFFDEQDRLYGMTRTGADEQLAEMTLRINAIPGNIPAKTIALPEGYAVS